MKAIFVELPAFTRYRTDYLSDNAFRALQAELMSDPKKGDVIEGTGGLRKLRFADSQRGKGKRGGLRVIYYWQVSAYRFLLFTLYDKDEATNLTAKEKALLKQMLNHELEARE